MVVGGVVLYVVAVLLSFGGVSVVRGVRRLAMEPMERVDFWAVPQQPRPAVERFRVLGFEPLGAVRIGAADDALYRTVCWSDDHQAFGRVSTSGIRPIDGEPAFITLVRGGRLVTSGSVPERLVPEELEEGFPGSSVDQLFDRHLAALRFLEQHGVSRAPTDPAEWFEDMCSDRDTESNALQQMRGISLVLKLLRVVLKLGGGPLAEQRGVVNRLQRQPFRDAS